MQPTWHTGRSEQIDALGVALVECTSEVIGTQARRLIDEIEVAESDVRVRRRDASTRP
jgi:hypothetical protein